MLTYLPQLDGVRAIAVFMVMAYHFIPGVDRVAPLGSIGVRLFFVLSGFLITRILLDARALPLGQAMAKFFIRRSLRILPLFYLVLLLSAAIDIGPVRQTFAWHATYLTNGISIYEATGTARSRTCGRWRSKSSSTCCGLSSSC